MGFRKNWAGTLPSPKIKFHLCLQYYASDLKKIQTSLALYDKNKFVSDYSTTIVHGTWNFFLIRLDPHRETKFWLQYLCYGILYTMINSFSTPSIMRVRPPLSSSVPYQRDTHKGSKGVFPSGVSWWALPPPDIPPSRLHPVSGIYTLRTIHLWYFSNVPLRVSLEALGTILLWYTLGVSCTGSTWCRESTQTVARKQIYFKFLSNWKQHNFSFDFSFEPKTEFRLVRIEQVSIQLKVPHLWKPFVYLVNIAPRGFRRTFKMGPLWKKKLSDSRGQKSHSGLAEEYKSPTIRECQTKQNSRRFVLFYFHSKTAAVLFCFIFTAKQPPFCFVLFS